MYGLFFFASLGPEYGFDTYENFQKDNLEISTSYVSFKSLKTEDFIMLCIF